MNKLKELRNENGLTLRELGIATNIDYSALNKLEKGIQQLNSYYIDVFTKFFNVSADYLLGLSDIRNPKEEIEKIIPSDFEYALFGEVRELSEEQKKDLMKFIAFLKVKDEK